MKLRLIVMVVCGAVCAAVGIVRGADAGETLPRDARAELARELFEPVSFNIGDYFFIQDRAGSYILFKDPSLNLYYVDLQEKR